MARRVNINTEAQTSNNDFEKAVVFLNFNIRLKDGSEKRITANGLPLLASHKVGGKLAQLIKDGKVDEHNLLDLLTVQIHVVDEEPADVEIDI